MKKCFEQPHKKRYNTEKDAERDILTFDSRNIRIYYCQSCGGWHLTSKKDEFF